MSTDGGWDFWPWMSINLRTHCGRLRVLVYFHSSIDMDEWVTRERIERDRNLGNIVALVDDSPRRPYRVLSEALSSFESLRKIIATCTRSSICIHVTEVKRGCSPAEA